MANYHFEVGIISRGKCRSVVRSASYITGKKLHDCYNGRTYYHQRMDVLYFKIFLPDNALSEFDNLQNLCDEINKAERRYDARTAREFKGSLPNELQRYEQKHIVEEFVNNNFIPYNLCAIVAERRIESLIRKNMSIFGVRNGQTSRIGLMNVMEWIFESAIEVLRYRGKIVSQPYI